MLCKIGHSAATICAVLLTLCALRINASTGDVGPQTSSNEFSKSPELSSTEDGAETDTSDNARSRSDDDGTDPDPVIRETPSEGTSTTSTHVDDDRNDAEMLPMKKVPALAKLSITPEHKILIVGECNFSFSRCLAEGLYEQNRGAGKFFTSFYKKPDIKDTRKKLKDNILAINLEKRGGHVIPSIDATKLSDSPLKDHKFDKILWTFPRSINDKRDNSFRERCRENNELLSCFLKNIGDFLTEKGEVILLLNGARNGQLKNWELDDLREPLCDLQVLDGDGCEIRVMDAMMRKISWIEAKFKRCVRNTRSDGAYEKVEVHTDHGRALEVARGHARGPMIKWNGYKLIRASEIKYKPTDFPGFITCDVKGSEWTPSRAAMYIYTLADSEMEQVRKRRERAFRDTTCDKHKEQQRIKEGALRKKQNKLATIGSFFGSAGTQRVIEPLQVNHRSAEMAKNKYEMRAQSKPMMSIMKREDTNASIPMCKNKNCNVVRWGYYDTETHRLCQHSADCKLCSNIVRNPKKPYCCPMLKQACVRALQVEHGDGQSFPSPKGRLAKVVFCGTLDDPHISHYWSDSELLCAKH